MSREKSRGMGAVAPRSRPADEQLVTLHFRVPLEVRKQVKLYAVRHGISMSELFLRAMKQAGLLDKERGHEESH